MARLLALLALAAVASSALAGSPCNEALKNYRVQEEYKPKCNNDLIFGKASEKTAPECKKTSPRYNRDTCASFSTEYRRCLMRENGLLALPTHNFNLAAFKKKKLWGNCDNDPKFDADFDKCYASTMKYCEYNRLFGCLIDATN